MSQARLPNLFVVGAQKAGTSSFCALVGRHPECFMVPGKEPMHFVMPDYRDRLDDYRALFADAGGAKVLADGSTGYLTHPYTAERIAEVCGREVKIVMLLRPLADRAVSAYYYIGSRLDDLRSPEEIFEPLLGLDLEEAIRREDANLQRAVLEGRIRPDRYHRYPDPRWPFRYLRNSLYSRQAGPFFEIFGPERTLVLSSLALRSDPGALFARVSGFLGVGPFDFPLREEESNVSKAPRAPKALRPVHEWYASVTTQSGTGLVNRALRRLYRTTLLGPPRPFPAELRTGLSRLLEPEVERLRAMGPQTRAVADSWAAKPSLRPAA